jgi:hypothetical protein
VTIPYQGETVLFDSGQALIILQANRIFLYSAEGKQVGEAIPFAGPVRLIQRSRDYLAIASWSGEVALIYDDGRRFTYSFAGRAGGFHIPGDITFQAGEVFIGFWSGEIYRLRPGEAPVLIARHLAGIHALQVLPGRLYICDFEGRLTILQDGKLIWSRPLEPGILLFQSFVNWNCLVAVGEKKLYHLAFQEAPALSEEAQPVGATAVLGGAEHIWVVDAQGRGIRYNPDLVIQSRFRVQPGATPRSADQSGKMCAFCHPDGSWSLMVGEQLSYNHLTGPIALAPNGDLVALGSQNGINILKNSDLPKLLGEMPNE